MAPFQFPDPSVATSITNTETGEVWVYVDGVWEVQAEDDGGVDLGGDVDFTLINNQLAQLTAAVNSLQTSIIEMNSRVSTLEGETVLIIE